MIKLVCIVEVAEAATVAEAQVKLDAFREAVQPTEEYGVCIYRASEADADAAYYYNPDGGDQDEDPGELEHNPTRDTTP